MTNNRTLRNSLVLSATLLIALALLFGSAPHVRALSRVGNSIPALAAPFAPDAWVQQAAKLTASDLAANDYFGGSIATSGDVVVVGTSRNTCTRAVYVFAKPAGGWSNATQTAKLTPSGVAPCPYFGAVAISGDTIAVGGGAEDAYRGAVFVFVKPPGGWVDMTQTAKLTASDRNDGFDELGASVAIHGDTIVAGAYRDNGERGSSYVFVKPPGGWSNITETAKLTASDSAAGDWFSHSVAISGDTIVVGSYKHNGHRGAAYVFVKPAGTWVNATQTAKLTGTTPCYTTLNAAVAAAASGDTIYVFPGTYAESVNLGAMATPGDIALVTVNAAGAPTPGTATINAPSGCAIYNYSLTVTGQDLTVNGFIVNSANTTALCLFAHGNIAVSNVTANNTKGEGVQANSQTGNITVTSCTANSKTGSDADGFALTATSGNVTISNSTANSNADEGFDVFAGGNTVISACTANGNGDDGFDLEGNGNVTVTNSVANNQVGSADGDGFDIDVKGAVTISDTRANGNRQEGIDVEGASSLTIIRCTATGNQGEGLDLDDVTGNVTVQDSNINGNGGTGIELGWDQLGGTASATGSIICNNTLDGLGLYKARTATAEGNWWGSASGPTHPNNPGGTGESVKDGSNGGLGTVDYTPWVNTVAGDLGLAGIGVPSQVRFQFSGGGGTTFLGQGPGASTGTAPFTLTTDNGQLQSSQGTGASVTEFINRANGTLAVTLVPASAGTATISLAGPCGLAGSLPVQVMANLRLLYLPLILR
jgi:parallel beta-helix repeat protein